MRHFQGARTMFVGFLTSLLLTAGGMVVAVHADDDEGTWALTADQAMACIQTALSTQAGSVKEVEAEDEGGKSSPKLKLWTRRVTHINSISMSTLIRSSR